MFTSAPRAVRAVAARRAVQREGVLDMGDQCAHPLDVSVLAAHVRGGKPCAVGERQGRWLPRLGKFRLYGTHILL